MIIELKDSLLGNQLLEYRFDSISLQYVHEAELAKRIV